MFAKCALHDDAYRGGCSGGARAGIIGSHPAFPGGGPAEFVGTPTRGGTARETALRTSLYFWTGKSAAG